MAIGTDIALAAAYLRQDEVIGMPTETVYGLAGNALKTEVVLKIFEIKKRPSFDPLIVHCPSIDAVSEYVLSVPAWAQDLMKQFCPRPLTLLLPKKNIIPDHVTSGLDRVAIRIPAHPVTSKLLHLLDFPLAAPSANPFGYISPTTALHVEAQLGSQIPYILDGGDCSIGLESTIVGEEDGKLIVYRAGGLSIAELEKIAGKLEIREGSSSPQAPGMLKSHYAPRKKFLLGNINELLQQYSARTFSILSFQKTYPGNNNRVLSPAGSMEEAAKNLFAYMRALDENDSEIIIAERVPNEGLGLAINDRLGRAAQ